MLSAADQDFPASVKTDWYGRKYFVELVKTAENAIWYTKKMDYHLSETQFYENCFHNTIIEFPT